VISVLANTSQSNFSLETVVFQTPQPKENFYLTKYLEQTPSVTSQTLPLFVVRLQELEELRHQRVFLRLPIFVA
jgi:hypothetical protein